METSPNFDAIVVSVARDEVLFDADCCGKRLKEGESVLKFRSPLGNATAPALQRSYYFHRRCLFSAIEKMPKDDTEVSRRYDGLREAIHASGKLFLEDDEWVPERVNGRQIQTVP